MNESAIALLVLRGVITDLDEADQKKIQAAAKKIRKIVDKEGDLGYMAVALVSCEITAEKS